MSKITAFGLAFFSALIVLATPAVNQRSEEDAKRKMETEVRSVLNQQVKAWNEGDVRGFMQGYFQSPQLRFASGATVTRGWKSTLDRYEKRYSTTDAMGKLAFRNLEVLVMSPKYTEVFGSWHLSRTKSGGGNASGLFTLLLEKTDDGWRVRHDHTSAAVD